MTGSACIFITIMMLVHTMYMLPAPAASCTVLAESALCDSEPHASVTAD